MKPLSGKALVLIDPLAQRFKKPIYCLLRYSDTYLVTVNIQIKGLEPDRKLCFLRGPVHAPDCATARLKSHTFKKFVLLLM